MLHGIAVYKREEIVRNVLLICNVFIPQVLIAHISQQTLADQLGSTQSSINRYENEQALPPADLLLRYADYFDVSLDYLFGRTDMPQGKLYAFKPTHTPEKEEMRRFIEMCFDPSSPANVKLKETLLRVMEGDDE